MNIQRGQISIVLIFAVFLVGGIYVLSKVKVSPIVQVSNKACVSLDNTKTVKFRGETYVKIRDETPLSLDIFNLHVPRQSETIEGRSIYLPQTRCERHTIDQLDPNYATGCNDNEKDLPASVDYYNTPGDIFSPNNIKAKDLLFLTIPALTPPPGFAMAEVFLSQQYLNTHDNQLPDFINKFCQDTNQPVDSKIMSGPPPSFLKKDMVPPIASELNDNLYKLIAYERTDSLFAKESLKSPPVGTYTYKGRVYDVRVRTYALYAYLVDKMDPTYGYFYSSKVPLSIPTSKPQDSQNALQIKTFDFVDKIYPWGWWTPECKPAIYLYPEKEMKVHVTVSPQGFLTYTNPLYPKSGWEVLAKPSGEVSTNGKSYPYLYYESKIKDSAINKPTKGYIVKFSEISKLYDALLPKLGLSVKEVKDFKDYWEKYLPYSASYFVGIMEDEDIEAIEPLTIDPKPTTIIRVRFYFEALGNLSQVLEKSAQIEEPKIEIPKRDGFTVVEWGGMVKVDKNHPFTCSQ